MTVPVPRAVLGTASAWHPLSLGVLLIVAVAPFTLFLDLERADAPVARVRLPLADIGLWVVLFLLVSVRIFRLLRRSAEQNTDQRGGEKTQRRRRKAGKKTLRRKRKRNVGLRPGWKDALRSSTYFGHVSAFLLLFFLSAAAQRFPRSVVVDLIQALDYLVVWAGLLLLVRDPLIVVRALSLVILSWALVACWQVFNGTPCHMVRSVFRDQETFAVGYCLVAPFAWAGLVMLKSSGPRLVGTGVLLGAACYVGSLLWTGLIIGEIVLTSRLIGRGWCRRLWPVLPVVVTTLLIAPAGYRAELFERTGVLWSGPLEQQRLEALQVEMSHATPPSFTYFGGQNWHVFLSSDLWEWARRHESPPPPAEDGTGPNEYFAASWSAVAVLSESPILGVGVGGWTNHVGTKYGILERTRTAPPNTINGFLLVAVTMGLVGLFLWLRILQGSFIAAVRALRSCGAAERAVPGAALASLCAFLVCMSVYPMFVQPVVVFGVISLVLVRHWEAEPAETRAQETDGK